MKRRGWLVAFARWTAALGGLLGASSVAQAQARPAAKPASFTLVHLNDVYEILPVEGGKSGGLARVATVIRRLKEGGTPVVTTLAGDYLSPSALGTAIVDDQPLAGRQMVDVLNVTGVDLATFGNHEFDVSETAFRAHLTQAKFRLLSTNVTDGDGQPFPGVATSAIVPVQAGGRTVRIGFIAVTVDATQKGWVRYREPIQAAKQEVERLRGKTDVNVALTHVLLEQDAEFVSAVPGIDLVLGGHEHENWLMYRGARFVPIVKADANVRSLAIVTLTFGKPGRRPEISARLQPIDDTIASMRSVDAVARQWVERGFDAFRRQGFQPEAIVAMSTDPLDGRESTVRNRAGRLTDIIAEAIEREGVAPDVALFNAGSVRIDDVVPPGPITQYDILRILPFGGTIVKTTFDGALLKRVLETGGYNAGLGGYLHVVGARQEGGVWQVRGKPLDPAVRYTVALPAFLLTGAETNMGFLKRNAAGVGDVLELRDIRRVVIDELARDYPVKPAAAR